MHSNKILPTIRCIYCQSPAERACYFPTCGSYPFICPTSSKCMFEEKQTTNVANGFHSDHSNSSCFLTVQEFRNRVQAIGQNLFKQCIQEAQSSVRKIKSYIDVLLNKLMDRLQQFEPRLSQATSEILNKLRVPLISSDLKGRDISFVLKEQNWYDKDDPEYREVVRYQRKFKSLISQVNDLLRDFEAETNKTQLSNSLIIPPNSAEKQEFQKAKQTSARQDYWHESEQENQYERKQRANADNPIVILSDSQDPKITETLENIETAKQLAAKKKFREAILKLLQSEKLNGSKNEVYALLEKYTQQLEQFQKILIKDYERLLQRNDKSPLFHYGLGLVMHKETNFSQSINQFNMALGYQESARFYYKRGVSQFQLQSYKDAIDSFTQAYSREKSTSLKALYIYRRGECCFLEAQYQQARSDLEQVLKLHPNVTKYIKLKEQIQKKLNESSIESRREHNSNDSRR